MFLMKIDLVHLTECLKKKEVESQLLTEWEDERKEELQLELQLDCSFLIENLKESESKSKMENLFEHWS